MVIPKSQQPVSERSAGLLLPVTSLPSAFGIGDLGPEARNFVDFLIRSRQKYWQILPLNPIEPGSGYSPYSTYSSMAGNTGLLSPELLVQDGLLKAAELAQWRLPATSQVDYSGAAQVREKCFERAYRSFCQKPNPTLAADFQEFCQQEAAWLDDFALYCGLKRTFNDTPWHQWPTEFRLRKPEALQAFSVQQADDLQPIKWLQFLFDRQWQQLRTYCHQSGIQLLGDLPFYVSYDSADVWAHPDIFGLDANGQLNAVAGVPPDYFNAEGQRWGMPVFRWNRLKERKYDWWVQRIRKNAKLFDLVRIDHFRALSEYWEIPAEETTAIRGEWKPGPGHDFFRTLANELGELPFVAEDLGDISEEVYQLRDAYGLPGMKVIQFAFHNDLPQSPHSPHNYTPNFIAYTGTHDNNTTRGWFRQDLSPADRKKVRHYAGKPVSERNVHLVLSQLVYASVARTVILPVQDVLGLDETARINTPAAAQNNWLWRLLPEQLTEDAAHQLREWVTLYNRW
ncbi:4-alpha-glucanotransferase [Larkinella bovis]|uniref:4-alpha-glucanotransferase n=1 Tax=Larkinella bovis TaxID=683041 RepID=A0ABW0I9P0_9BACT